MRFLLLEDNAIDAQVVQRMLLKGEWEHEVIWVKTREKFVAALASGAIDLILADYELPEFNGTEALTFAAQHYPEIPLIFVSGSLGEELAIDLLKQGATDYVFKQRLGRLIPSINRALREAQEKRDRKQAEVERERLLRETQAAREEAETANRIKDEFLAVLSHELRTPLNPILGWLRILQSGRLDAAKTKDALAIIDRNAQLQAQLIEDLLDVSRILRGKLTLMMAPVTLSIPIRAAMETVRLAAEAKQIQIQIVCDAEVGQVLGDVSRLQQVVWNLLSNAVKFTPNGGRVDIGLMQVGSMAQITVSDTGKGIAPEFLPHVFEHFRQEDGSTTRKFGGLGLGLAIARQIVELHGGTITAASKGEHKGAVFTVKLPVLGQSVSAASEPVSTNRTIEDSLNNLQILMVDDDDDTREFQAFVLEQSGAIVTAVSSGVEALQVLDRFMPDVLVSDIGMPDIDGYLLIQRVRSRSFDQGGMIPAIALTAYAGEIDQQKALQSGFQAHVTKPVEPGQLIKVVVNLIRR